MRIVIGSISIHCFAFLTKALAQVEPATQNDAVPEYTKPVVEELNRGSVYLDVIGSLLLVLALVLLLAFLAKKFLPSTFNPGKSTGHIKMLQMFPLGNRRHLALIEVDQQRMLLGVTEQQVQLIKTIGGFEQTLAEVDAVKTVGELLEDES